MVDEAADELYGLAPADFTKARDELARRLRKEGRRDEADAVKKLRRPTVAAWALNQLARRRPADVRRLLETGARLREAQRSLLTGGGERSALQAAARRERALVAELARDATAVAGEGGTAGTTALDEKIRATLHAAVLDEETAAGLAAGRLEREREAAGLFGATAIDVPRARPAPASARRKRPHAGQAAAKSADRRGKLERELAAAKADEQRAQRAHAEAVKGAARARQRAKAADTAVREAERREKEAARARDRAVRAVAAARKKLG